GVLVGSGAVVAHVRVVERAVAPVHDEARGAELGDGLQVADAQDRDGVDAHGEVIYGAGSIGSAADFQPLKPSAITATFVNPASAARPAASCEACQSRLVQ